MSGWVDSHGKITYTTAHTRAAWQDDQTESYTVSERRGLAIWSVVALLSSVNFVLAYSVGDRTRGIVCVVLFVLALCAVWRILKDG